MPRYQKSAHRYFIILKNCLELSDVSDELLQTISFSLASSAVLSTLTREGRSFVFSVAPKTPHDRILAYGQFMAKPQNAFNSHRNDHNSRFSERSQDHNTFRKNSSYASSKSDHHPNSYKSNAKAEPTDFFPNVVTCYKCHNEGHYADRCPEMRPIQVKSSSSSSSNAKSSTPATAKRKNDSDKRVECIESGESYGLNSDEGKLTDCINLVDGMPKELNLTVEGTINGKPVNLKLDSGAEVSVISQDFVKPR